eukprot:354470-Chlamydomonas_euryale.AAC.12
MLHARRACRNENLMTLPRQHALRTWLTHSSSSWRPLSRWFSRAKACARDSHSHTCATRSLPT